MPKLVVFCHSLRSDWNHGNAHFLRGISSEFWHRGFDVAAVEPAEGWSAANLAQDRLPQSHNPHPALAAPATGGGARCSLRPTLRRRAPRSRRSRFCCGGGWPADCDHG